LKKRSEQHRSKSLDAQIQADADVHPAIRKGVLRLIPSTRSTAAAIEGIFLAWLIWTPDNLQNRIQWLP